MKLNPFSNRAVFSATWLLFCLMSAAQEDMTAGSGVLKTVPASGRDAVSSITSKDNEEKWVQELLRDPFWPIGFFPPDWQKEKPAQTAGGLDASGWKAASGKIRISAASRLGEKTAAIVNGELKSVGDQIEILHEGRIYQWQIIGIDAAGQVQLKKQSIR